VTATLVDDNGRPVPLQWTWLELRAAANHWPEWQGFVHAISRRDGTLEFPGVRGSTTELRVHFAGGAGAASSEPFALRGGEARDVVLRMQRPGVVEGTALGPDGMPLPAARVGLCNADPTTGEQSDSDWLYAACDRDGRFRFVGVAPGGHRLWLDDVGTQLRSSGLITVEPGATVQADVQAR